MQLSGTAELLAGPKATPTPTGRGAPGARTNPIHLGQSADLGNGWKLTINRALVDGTEYLLSANHSYPAPESGSAYLVIFVRATYDSRDVRGAVQPVDNKAQFGLYDGFDLSDGGRLTPNFEEIA